MKKIAVIGITGSIGTSTVEVVKNHPELFRISLATSHCNEEQLLTLKQELNIDKAVITKESSQQSKGILYGQEELFCLLAQEKYDVVINAVSGSAGLIYSYHILKYNHKLALANKESLVLAGHILTKMSSDIIPIDSEHSALLQLMRGLKQTDVKKLILTASGGPFLETPVEHFKDITPTQALQHPTWEMGAKITIDSATMFNKGLEIIEANRLFGIDYSQLEAIIHPQSIIHSLIECKDGSLLAQMSKPSMHLPILYALTYPHHIASSLTQTGIIDFPAITFQSIDIKRYPLYYLTVDAGKAGGLMPTAINAANEAAIRLFLEHKINFTQIHSLIADYLDDFNNLTDPSIETIIEANDYIFQEVYNSL